VRRLRDVGEHAWVARLVHRLAMDVGGGVHIGPGDDAAVVRPGRASLVLTVDALVEGVHFRTGWLTPAALGRRLFGVTVSDVAAMGATPRWALLATESPAETASGVLDGIVRGFARGARGAGTRLVGGNVTTGPHLALTATVVGEIDRTPVSRAGGRPGDALYVTGALGMAGIAVRQLAGGRGGRLPQPPLRVRAGRLLAAVASAMIDVSDGLVQDIGHLCRASRVAAEVELDRLPVAPRCRRALGAAASRFAATAGEDYELVLAVRPAREAALRRIVPRLGCRLTRIGRLVAGRPAVRVIDAAGTPITLARSGFDHFRR